MNHLIVIITFNAPAISIDKHLLRQHHALLQKGYESGYILIYGPREPEEGTIAVARVESRQELLSALNADPLISEGIASYAVMEFAPIRFPASLQGWVDPLVFRHPSNDVPGG